MLCERTSLKKIRVARKMEIIANKKVIQYWIIFSVAAAAAFLCCYCHVDFRVVVNAVWVHVAGKMALWVCRRCGMLWSRDCCSCRCYIGASNCRGRVCSYCVGN